MSALHWTEHAASSRRAGHIASFLSLICDWFQRMENRRELAALCDRTLRDIGITRLDAMREANKPFWRP